MCYVLYVFGVCVCRMCYVRVISRMGLVCGMCVVCFMWLICVNVQCALYVCYVWYAYACVVCVLCVMCVMHAMFITCAV